MVKLFKTTVAVVVILGLLTIAATYYKYFVLLDYMVQVEVDCDPQNESCFVYECDPITEECTGIPEEDTWYYKILHRKAFNMPHCDPYSSESCSALTCAKGEADCYEELCEISTENQCSIKTPEIGTDLGITQQEGGLDEYSTTTGEVMELEE